MSRWPAAALAAAAPRDGDRAVLADGAQMRAVVHRFAAGTHVPAHVHAASEEAFLVVSGTATVTIDGTPHPAAPGDLLFAHGGEPHDIRVDPAAPLVLLVVVAPNVHDQQPL